MWCEGVLDGGIGLQYGHVEVLARAAVARGLLGEERSAHAVAVAVAGGADMRASGGHDPDSKVLAGWI